MVLALGSTEFAPIVAAMSAVILGIALGRYFPAERRAGWRAVWTVCLAFCAGWLVLNPLRTLAVTRSFHWQFYLTLGIAGLSFVDLHRGWKRVALPLAAFAVCAWLLTPNWATLHPPRPVWILLLTVYLTALAVLLEPLPRRFSPLLVILAMVASSSMLAVLVAASLSITTGVTAALASAALTGWLAGTGRGLTPGAVSALAIPYSLLVGGTAFAAAIYPRPPVWSVFAIPLAPLVMWCCARGPLSRFPARSSRMLIPLALVGLMLMALSVWILLPRGGPAADEW